MQNQRNTNYYSNDPKTMQDQSQLYGQAQQMNSYGSYNMMAAQYQAGYQHHNQQTQANDINRYNDYVRDYYKKYQEIQLQQQMQLQNNQGLLNTSQNSNKSIDDMNAITITEIVEDQPGINRIPIIGEYPNLNRNMGANPDYTIQEKSNTIASEVNEVPVNQANIEKNDQNLKTFNNESLQNTMQSNNSIKNSINFDEKLNQEKNNMILMQNELTKSQISNDQSSKIFLPEFTSFGEINEKDDFQMKSISLENNSKKNSGDLAENSYINNDQNVDIQVNMAVELNEKKNHSFLSKNTPDLKNTTNNIKSGTKSSLQIETTFLEKEENFKKKEHEFKMKQQNNLLSIPSFELKTDEKSSNFNNKEDSQNQKANDKIKILFSPIKSKKVMSFDEKPFNLENDVENLSMDEKSNNTFDIANQIDLDKINFTKDQDDM